MNFAEPESLAAEVMRIYRGLSEEERSGTGSDVYHDCFGKITESGDYQTLYKVLHDFSALNDVDDVYYAVYDRDTSALIYIVDPDTRNRYIKNTSLQLYRGTRSLGLYSGGAGRR